MYHPYKNGYSTLPDLKKINFHQVFEKNQNESEAIQIEKAEAIANQNYFFEYKNDSKFYKICEEFILKYYPRKLKSNNYLDIAREIDEDLIIHRLNSEEDYVSSAHVCLPSSWLPENKVGKNFKQIHQDVPMNLKNSDKLVKAIMSGSFERFVWSVVFEKKYNYHPRFKKQVFDVKNPKLFVKVERQVTVGFGDFCLFILRQYLVDEKEIDKKSLYNSLINMTPEQRKYKDLDNIDPILEYLLN